MTLVQRLLVLIGAVLAVFVAAWLYEAESVSEVQGQIAARNMQQALSVVASRYDNFVESAQQAVTAASLEAERAVGVARGCQIFRDWLRTSDLAWLRLNVLDAAGMVRCSTEPDDVGNDMSHYPEVLAARANGRILIGDYAWGLFSGAPGLVIVNPWHGADGVNGIVAALARLDPLVRALPGSLPRGYAAILADRGGRILAAEPPDPAVIGRVLPPALSRLARMAMTGQLSTLWIDGSTRVVAYAPADGPRGRGVFLALAGARDAEDAGASRFASVFGLGFLITAVGAFMVAWWGGVKFIRQPLGELAAVALRWRDGDQAARVTLPGRSEIAALGRVFNEMADAKDHSDRQMRETAELLTALIESSRDSISVFDRDGRLLVANSTFLELADLTPGAAVGRKLVMPHDVEMQQALDCLREQVVIARAPQTADVFVQTADDGQRVLQTICAPILSANGEVRAVAGIGRDVTEARDTAETLRAARDRAQAADRAKTRFLAAASHDLRQPLQAAIMLADLVVRNARGSIQTITLGERLQGSLEDFKRLLDSLFDVSRLDSGTVQPELSIFPLAPLLNQITTIYKPLAESKGIVLLVEWTDAFVRSDRVLLARMLSNLVENGVRYTRAGHVAIKCQVTGAVLQIRIEDTGIGIPQEDLSRIWQEFEQLHNPARDRRQGLGLGLSIVQRLATLLDHPVEVGSEPGQGSSFVVSVPSMERQAETPAERFMASAARPNEGGRLVVIIDDDEMVLDVLRMMLEEWGWDVIAALDSGDAIRELASARHAPDLIIADYRLREGEVGADAIVAIHRETGRRVPAFILTGELAGAEGEPDRPLQDAQKVGAALFRKPINSKDLFEAIRSVMAESTA